MTCTMLYSHGPGYTLTKCGEFNPGLNAVWQCLTCEQATLPGTKLALLQAAVDRYLEKPGCNNGTRMTAMAKLIHALEESKK